MDHGGSPGDVGPPRRRAVLPASLRWWQLPGRAGPLRARRDGSQAIPGAVAGRRPGASRTRRRTGLTWLRQPPAGRKPSTPWPCTTATGSPCT